MREVTRARFSKVERLERDDWVYQLVLRSTDDLDDELHSWLTEAYLVGQHRG